MLYPDFKSGSGSRALGFDSDIGRNSRASHAALSTLTAWGFINLWILIQEVPGGGIRAEFSNQLPSSRAIPGVAK